MIGALGFLGGGGWLLVDRLRPAPWPDTVRTADQNVLLVTIDTLRADALALYGGLAATPNLDRLASRGVRFDFAHAHAVVTLPSHASMLTGLYPYQHGIRDNSGYRLDPAMNSLATTLKGAGHATGAFVGAFPLDSRFGLDQGFDVYDDRFGVSAGPADFSIAERPGDRVVDAANAWIAAQRDRWFAWVHVFDPHAPYRAPTPYDAQHAGSPYHGEVAFTDHALGPLFDQAARGPRPTLVIVTSDHGEALGDHGEMTHGLFAYEATLRVPLVIAQLIPGEETPPRGRAAASDRPARHIDLVPTVLEALGREPIAGLPGRSLLGPPAAAPGDEAVVSYFEAMSASLNRGWAPLSGLIVGREKFIDLPLPELYDLSIDPGETDNLIGRRADRGETLDKRLADLGAPPPGDRLSERADVLDRLKALGYVTGAAPRKTDPTERDDPKRLIEIDRAVHDAIDRFQRGRPREAIALYRGVIERRADMEIAYRHLAFIHWELGELQEAIDTLQAGSRAGVTSEAMQSQLGIYLAESGQPAAALPLLEAVTSEADPDLETLNALGIAYARANRPDRARAAFDRVLALDPAHAPALENIGALRLQARDYVGARAAFERALAVAPEAARAHAGLGVIALQQGDPAAAVASWTRAVALDPRDFDSLYNLATELVNQGRVDEARPHLERFVDQAPVQVYTADIARLRTILEHLTRGG